MSWYKHTWGNRLFLAAFCCLILGLSARVPAQQTTGFRFIDSSGSLIGLIDESGNLSFKNGVTTGTITAYNPSWYCKNSSAILVGQVKLDGSSNVMRVKRNIITGSVSTTNAVWTWKNSSGTPKACLNSDGDLYLAGQIASNAPSNLDLTSKTESAVRVLWTDNSTDESGFRIERSESPTGGYTLIRSEGSHAGTGTVTWTDRSVFAGTTYYYRVCATNSNGANSFYTWGSVTTDDPFIAFEAGTGGTRAESATDYTFKITVSNRSNKEIKIPILINSNQAFLNFDVSFPDYPNSVITIPIQAYPPSDIYMRIPIDQV